MFLRLLASCHLSNCTVSDAFQEESWVTWSCIFADCTNKKARSSWMSLIILPRSNCCSNTRRFASWSYEDVQNMLGRSPRLSISNAKSSSGLCETSGAPFLPSIRSTAKLEWQIYTSHISSVITSSSFQLLSVWKDSKRRFKHSTSIWVLLSSFNILKKRKGMILYHTLSLWIPKNSQLLNCLAFF